MLDITSLRQDKSEIEAIMARRGKDISFDAVIDMDKQYRTYLTDLQDLQQKRNETSKKIGQAKSKGEDASPYFKEVSTIKDQMGSLEEKAKSCKDELDSILASMPNIIHSDVPIGKDEEDNVEIRRHGTPRQFDFKPLEHTELGHKLNQMDFELAAKLAGSRFVVLSGALAKLERALAAFMIDIQTKEFGYREVTTPTLVRGHVPFGTGQLPKFEEDLFKTTDDRYLIPTAEVTLTNLVANAIIDEEKLPLRLTALTDCFRSEAGAAGRDTHGMIRQHQFKKVELVSIVHPEKSDEELERLLGCAEEVLKRLDIPYRVMLLCSGDIGFSAYKTYDIEVWLPGQDRYREISSCSNCIDFQARRMKARFKGKSMKKPQFVHSLNGSGLAVGRCLIAVLENYQSEDGTIEIPKNLIPYMGGIERISPDDLWV